MWKLNGILSVITRELPTSWGTKGIFTGRSQSQLCGLSVESPPFATYGPRGSRWPCLPVLIGQEDCLLCSPTPHHWLEERGRAVQWVGSLLSQSGGVEESSHHLVCSHSCWRPSLPHWGISRVEKSLFLMREKRILLFMHSSLFVTLESFSMESTITPETINYDQASSCFSPQSCKPELPKVVLWARSRP